MKEPWSIKSRARECALSGEAFVSGQKIRAAIFPDPDSSGYLRKDFTQEAWEAREEKEAPFSTWLTTYEPPVVEEKAEDVVDQDPETLLHKLVEEDEEHTENVRYILAIMLERQKLLRETDTQEVPSGILRVYEHRKTGDVYLIKDPQIPLSDVDKVQDEVRELLDPQPAEEPEEVPADSTEEPEAESDEAKGPDDEPNETPEEGEQPEEPESTEEEE